MHTNKIHLGIMLIIFVTFLVACGGAAPAIQPTATSIYITYPTAEYTDLRTVIENTKGKIEMGSVGTLPNELPRDVPIYYPGFPTSWMISYSGSMVAIINIGIEVGSDQTSVLDWYRSYLLSNSWTIGPLAVDLGSFDCGQVKPEVIGAKKDNRFLQVSVCATACQSYCKTDISLAYKTNN
jgi:hypothetical protein